MDDGIYMKRCPVYCYALLNVPIEGNYIYGLVATFLERRPKRVQYKGKAWNYVKHLSLVAFGIWKRRWSSASYTI